MAVLKSLSSKVTFGLSVVPLKSQLLPLDARAKSLLASKGATC